MAHEHLVIDSDIRFEIDPYTRTLKDLTPARKTIVQYDHNSERYTFALPRWIEGHDMALCNLVEVHFSNIDGDTDVSYDGKCPITDLKVSETDDQVVILSWLVSKISTQHVGPLHFSLRFACVDSDSEVTYEWNTRKFTAIRVVAGMSNREAMDQIDAQVQDTIERLGLEYPTETYFLIDEEGTEVAAVLVENETELTATANDIRLGTTAVTTDGVTLGEKDIPSYNTTEGWKIVPSGSSFIVPLSSGKHEYTKLQAIFCPFNTSPDDSVAAEKVAIDDCVYPVRSIVPEAAITAVNNPNGIDFGVTNSSEIPWIIRFFTYKEVY